MARRYLEEICTQMRFLCLCQAHQEEAAWLPRPASRQYPKGTPQPWRIHFQQQIRGGHKAPNRFTVTRLTTLVYDHRSLTQLLDPNDHFHMRAMGTWNLKLRHTATILQTAFQMPVQWSLRSRPLRSQSDKWMGGIRSLAQHPQENISSTRKGHIILIHTRIIITAITGRLTLFRNRLPQLPRAGQHGRK